MKGKQLPYIFFNYNTLGKERQRQNRLCADSPPPNQTYASNNSLSRIHCDGVLSASDTVYMLLEFPYLHV